MQKSLISAVSIGGRVGSKERVIRWSRLEMHYFVASQFRSLESVLRSFPPFRVRDMTCRDDRVHAFLKSIVNRATDEFVAYV